MPVTGRLDGQVEEVIIKPIGRRPAGGDDSAPQTASDPETASDSTALPHSEPRETRRGGRVEIRHDDGELPVWLL